MVSRRAFIRGVSPIAVGFLAGCNGKADTSNRLDTPSNIRQVDFETGNTEIECNEGPVVKEQKEENQLTVLGCAKVGPQNCRKLSVGRVSYDSDGKLTFLVEPVDKNRSFIDKQLHGCEIATYFTEYSATVYFNDTFPSELLVIERYEGEHSTTSFKF